MRPVSAAFAQAVVASSQRRATRVTLLRSDYSVEAVLTGSGGVTLDGLVTTDVDRRRSCSISFIDPDLSLAPSEATDAFFPNRIIRVERGLYVGEGAEYVTLGTFLIDRPVIDVGPTGLKISVQAQDRLKLAAKSRVIAPEIYDSGTPIGTVLTTIAQRAGMGTTLYAMNDGGKSLAVDRFLDPDTDRVTAMMNLAHDYALDLYVDADGFLTCQPSLTSLDGVSSVWGFSRGSEAIMLGLTKELSDDRLYNHVLVSGEASDLPPVTAEARDLNPASPAYNPLDGTGPIGDRLYTYTSPLIRDTQMAQEVADALLLRVALIEEAVRLPSVVHPALEVGDAVDVNEPASKTTDVYLIDTLAVPIGPGAMTLTARKLRSLT